jgi:hypothetical protein
MLGDEPPGGSTGDDDPLRRFLRIVASDLVDPTAQVTIAEAGRPQGAALIEPRLTRPWPNPSSGVATVQFALPRAARASVAVLDVQGRGVRTVLDEILTAGEHEVRWDGTDHTGRPLPTGIYFVRLTTCGRTLMSRFVMTR